MQFVSLSCAAAALIRVPGARMLEAVAANDALCVRMLCAVCARTQRLMDAITSTASGTASVRVARCSTGPGLPPW